MSTVVLWQFHLELQVVNSKKPFSRKPQHLNQRIVPALGDQLFRAGTDVSVESTRTRTTGSDRAGTDAIDKRGRNRAAVRTTIHSRGASGTKLDRCKAINVRSEEH